MHLVSYLGSCAPCVHTCVGHSCSEVAVRLVAHYGATQLSVYYGSQLCAQGKREEEGVRQRGRREGREQVTVGDAWCNHVYL